MSKSAKRLLYKASPVKKRIISKLLSWAATPQVMSNLLLGKMAFKMAIASAISLVIAQGLRWEYPFYAVIAAIIVMSSTHSSTLKLGIQRLIGTTIGAIAGAIFAIAFGSNFLSLALCVFLTIFFASYYKINEAAKLAGYVAAIVIVNYSQSPWLYAWHRYSETFLGIAVALLVNNWIFPARAGTELRRYLSQTLVHLEEFYRSVVDCALTGKYDRSKADVLKLSIINSLLIEQELWQEVRHGQSDEPIETRLNDAWEFLIRRIWEHILTMEHTVLARKHDNYWQMLSPQISHLAQETQYAMLSLATAVEYRQSHLYLSGIEMAIAHAMAELNQLREIQQVDYSIDELLRFLTFFYTIEEVGRKLQRMAVMLNPAQ